MTIPTGWDETRMELTNGYNIQKRSVLGHEPWLVIFCWNNARQAKIVHSAKSKAACTRWVNAR